MTAREAAIVSAYTGKILGQFRNCHGYIEELMGRPVFTHELPALRDELQKRAKADFVGIEVAGEQSP